jgi:hypothetical protein
MCYGTAEVHQYTSRQSVFRGDTTTCKTRIVDFVWFTSYLILRQRFGYQHRKVPHEIDLNKQRWKSPHCRESSNFFRLNIIFEKMRYFQLLILLEAASRGIGLIALTASSPYRIVLSPTNETLSPISLKAIESVTADWLMKLLLEVAPNYTSNETKIVDSAVFDSIEIVVQNSDLVLEAQNVIATKIKFIALGTIRGESAGDNEASHRDHLNAAIQDAFSTMEKRKLFLSNLLATKNPQLQSVDTVYLVVASSVPPVDGAPEEKSSGRGSRRLSTLDIILISVSICILLGVCWMLCVHYLDQGYFENQRLQAVRSASSFTYSIDPARQAIHRNEDELSTNTETPGKKQISVYDKRPVVGDSNDGTGDRNSSVATPVSDSSVHTTVSAPIFRDFQGLSFPSFETSNLRNQTGNGEMKRSESEEEDRRRHLHNVETAPSISALRNLVSSQRLQPDDSTELEGISQSFDGDKNWFRSPQGREKKTTLPPLLARGTAHDATESQTCSSSSNSSEDVFGIDIAASESVADKSTGRADPQALSEWMSTIHVVTTENRSNGNDHMSMESPRSSPARSTHDFASLDHVSLEESMASSWLGYILQPREIQRDSRENRST